jgi:hypothetical protein
VRNERAIPTTRPGDVPISRPDRRRIVERWIERDYDVPASDGDGRAASP